MAPGTLDVARHHRLTIAGNVSTDNGMAPTSNPDKTGHVIY
jgi:hypothetical protein